MTGFKDGSSGDDPFSSDSSPDADTDSESEMDGSGQQLAAPEAEAEAEPETGKSTDAGSPPSGGLPWIYKRDSITDGRSTVQLHLQEDTLEYERQKKLDVEDALGGETVPKADLREAALLVGMANSDEIAEVLRDWGYDFE